MACIIGFVLGWVSVVVCVILTNDLRKTRMLLASTYRVAHDQHVIIQAMLSKGIEVRCDWCGNPMAPDVAIEVVEQDDGSVWVQHQSHGI